MIAFAARRLLLAIALVSGAIGAACIIGPKQDDPAPSATTGLPGPDAGFVADTADKAGSDVGTLIDGAAPDGGATSDSGPPGPGGCGTDGGDPRADGGADAAACGDGGGDALHDGDAPDGPDGSDAIAPGDDAGARE